MGQVSVPLRGILKLAAVAFVLLCPSYSRASEVSLHGFLQGNFSLNTASENPNGEEFKWAEERLQLKMEAVNESSLLFLKTDFFYDHVDDDTRVELREGYLDLVYDNWDLRFGRQIITWGLGDLVFVNDLFPKDYEAFYSGRPLEYMKKGVDGVKAGLYPSFASFDVVLVPSFTPDTFPRGDRFRSSQDLRGDDPAVTFENTEVAVRAYRSIGERDVALYYYRGFYGMPSVSSAGRLFYPELSVYGASVEGRAMGGILGLEAGYYDSGQDRAGDDPSVPNSSTRFLVAYKRQLMEDFTLGLQYFLEHMHDYSAYERTLPAGFPKADRLYQLATLRLTRFLMHQNLKLSLFAFYSPSADDYMLNPEVKYKFTDNVWAAVGGIIFGGEADGQFGRLDRNDNAYLQIRYEF